MIDIVLFCNYKISDRIRKYINLRLSEVVRVFIDFMDDNNGFDIDYCISLPNMRGNTEDWKQKVHELYEILISHSTRNYIKPYYEYLLYSIVEWYIDCNSDDNRLLHFSIPEDLQTAISQSDDIPEDEKAAIFDHISNLKQYKDLVFEDNDFFPDNVANMVMIYLDNREMFDVIFGDIDLDDFYLLMPGDIQDLYNESKNNITSENTSADILDDIMFVCTSFMRNKTYANEKSDENSRNDYFRDMLRKKYATSDQTRQGLSYSGKSAGLVDIVLHKNNYMVAIIESLNLDGVDTNRISEHIDKVFNYDTIGNKVNFVISYVDVSDFSAFWKKYVNYVSSYTYKYPIIKIDESAYEQYSEIKIMSVDLDRNNVSTRLYHIAIHIQLPDKE